MGTPKIMNMDWKSVGYWPVYRDGKVVWERQDKNDESNN